MYSSVRKDGDTSVFLLQKGSTLILVRDSRCGRTEMISTKMNASKNCLSNRIALLQQFPSVQSYTGNSHQL